MAEYDERDKTRTEVWHADLLDLVVTELPTSSRVTVAVKHR